MTRLLSYVLLLLLAMFSFTSIGAANNAATAAGVQHSSDVMQQFNQDNELAPERAISVKSKHQILFLMGGALLILILIAASLGIAMGIFGKDVFVWHMLSAGLATTLAIAHAVVAFVWFYPTD